MTRALFWKEWREQRPIVIAGLALALAMPLVLVAGASTIRRHADLDALASAMPVLFAALMWPLMAVACGASTISGEIGDGTLGFLLTRPASRFRVWLVKVATAGIAVLVIVAGSLAVSLAFVAVARGGDLSGLWEVDLGHSILSELVSFAAVAVGGGLFLGFACSVFFSTFLSRSMTAAAAGLATATVIGALLFLLWTRLDLVPLFEPGLLGLELGAAGVLALVASLWLFAGGELLAGRGMLRHALLGGTAALAALGVVSVPVVLAHTRLDPDSAELSDLGFVSGRSAVVARAHSSWGSSSQIWLLYLDGSGLERLTGRLAGWPATSPDGRLVAYASGRGPFGLRSDEASVHVVAADGSGDRLVVAGLAGLDTAELQHRGDAIRFSPRGDRLVFVDRSELVVAAVDGSSVVRRPLDELEGAPPHAEVVGFTPDEREVVLLSPSWGGNRGTRLVAVDPESAHVREILASPRMRVWGTPPVVVRDGAVTLRLAVDAPGAAEDVFSVVDVNVVDGSTESVFEAPCGTIVALSDDGKKLAYGACPPSPGRVTSTEIRFRDRVTGVDFASVSVAGRPWSIELSPTADRVAIRRFAHGVGALSTVVLRTDGSETEFDPDWIPLGWTGRDSVVLARMGDSGYDRVAVGDADSGALRIVFP